MLGEASVGGDPLGRAIIGTAAVVSGTPAADIARFHGARYTQANLVIAAAGTVDHDALVALARSRGAPRPRPLPKPWPCPERRRACAPGSSSAWRRHCALPAAAAASSPRKPSSSTSPSGGPGSRAMTTVASRSGCSTRSSGALGPRGCSTRCAATRPSPAPLYSFTSGYHDTRQVDLYIGARPDDLDAAMEVVAAESLITSIATRRPPARGRRPGEPQGTGGARPRVHQAHA